MNKQTIITILLLLTAVNGWAQEERIDTVIPKYLSNGYFFREMPQLPDGEMTMSKLKDKEGNSVIVINVDATLPKSLVRKAIPREQVHNADQFLNGLNIMATMKELTQTGVKADGTFYYPQAGEMFPLSHGRTTASVAVSWCSTCGIPAAVRAVQKCPSSRNGRNNCQT